jgi:GT2 family glycosyltransferase
MNRVRSLVRLIVPLRIRRALGIAMFGMHERWSGRQIADRVQLEDSDLVVPIDDPSSSLEFPPARSPRVSIVVPVHDAWCYTHLCLRAILEHTPRSPSYEVILADDASTDETQAARGGLRNIAVLRDGLRRGYVANCNHAVRKARGEYVVLLNNDTVVQPGWLGALVAAADRAPDVGIVGGKVVARDGSLQEAGCFILPDGTPVARGFGADPKDPAFACALDVEYVSGCCLLVRRSLWERIGGFDERFAPAYYEDVDLAYAVRARGFRVMYEPESVVLHFRGVTYGQEPTSGTTDLLARNAEKFTRKWRSEAARRV